MSTQIPATTDAEAISSWSDEVDVLVVGAGMAGVSAAIEAARSGARVLVLDRGGRLSCTSAMAGGHFYLGGGTPVQQAGGFDDTPAEMATYLSALSPECDPEKIRVYSEGSVEHFSWLESLGFAFERSFWAGKAAMQPGTQGVMFSGNERLWPFDTMAVPAPRGHKPPVEGDLGGASLVLELALARLQELGVPVRHDTGVTGLVVERTGSGAGRSDDRGSDSAAPDAERVVGARWKHFDETGAVRAGAIVIAAGGFVMNAEMVHEHAPRLEALLARGMPLGNPHDDGLGIRLGESVGGVPEHMEGSFLTGPFYPPGDLLKGICINNRGERFVAEDSYHSRTTSFVLDQPDQQAWLILDSAHMAEPAYGLQPLVDGWESIAEMEEGLGVPAGSLERTLQAYNASARDGQDPSFHKAAEYVEPLDAPPYGAYDMTPGRCFYAGFTCGGLRVDHDGRLLGRDRGAIDGVYAAGACASNIALDGRGYSSGIQLGEASFFGRRAGRHAARTAANDVTADIAGRLTKKHRSAGRQEETWA